MCANNTIKNLKMSCPICASDYYIGGPTTPGDNECEYIADSGKKCSKKAIKDSDICKLHERQRVPIKCLSCEKDCCKICYRKFFLTLSEEPHCIHCKKNFDLEFLLGTQVSIEGYEDIQRFSKTFIWGPWKTHRESVLLEQIMIRLPEYQPIAAAELGLRNAKDLMDEANSTRHKIKQEIRDSNEKGKAKKYREANSEYREARSLYYKAYRKLYNLNNTNVREDTEKSEKPKEFLTRGKCPKDDCNGFIEERWKCGMCETVVCSHCMCINDEGHKCSQDDIETTKLIRESTKPCPGCRARIQRSQGCNQMFCTHCHIFFDWATGNQIKKTRWVHNPEHIEWMRTNGLSQPEQQLVQNGCHITYADIYALKLDRKYEQRIIELIRHNQHNLEQVENHRSSLERNNKKSSIDYLKGLITKEKLAILVQRHFKAEKKQELKNLRYHMMYDTISQIFRVMISDISKILNERSTIEKITDKLPGSQFFKQSPDKKIEIVENTLKMISNLEKLTAESVQKIEDLF